MSDAIKVQRADDANITLTLSNSDGSAYDATGKTLTFTVRKSPTTAPVITKTITNFTGAGHNIATIALTKADLTLDVRAWRYELAMTDAGGTNRRSSGYNAFYVTEKDGQPGTVNVQIGSSLLSVAVTLAQSSSNVTSVNGKTGDVLIPTDAVTVGPVGTVADFVTTGTGDDVTLQAAATKAAGALPLFLFAGTYKVKHPVSLSKGQRLIGAGRDYVNWRYDTAAPEGNFSYNYLLNGRAIGSNPVGTNCHVSGINFDADPANFSTSNGLSVGLVEWQDSWIVEECSFGGTPYFRNWVNGVKGGVSRNNFYYGTDGASGHHQDAIGGGTCEDFLVFNNVFTVELEALSVIDHVNSNGVKFVLNRNYSAKSAYLEGGEGWLIDGNRFTGGGQLVLQSDAGYQTVDGQGFRTVAHNVRHSTVSNNHVYAAGGLAGILIGYDFGSTTLVKGGGNKIIGNTIISPAQCGILMTGNPKALPQTFINAGDLIDNNVVVNPNSANPNPITTQTYTGTGTIETSAINIAQGYGVTIGSSNSLMDTRPTPKMQYGVQVGQSYQPSATSEPNVIRVLEPMTYGYVVGDVNVNQPSFSTDVVVRTRTQANFQGLINALDSITAGTSLAFGGGFHQIYTSEGGGAGNFSISKGLYLWADRANETGISGQGASGQKILHARGTDDTELFGTSNGGTAANDVGINTKQSATSQNDVRRVTVKGGSGRVGIGTTTPGSLLEVAGTVTAASFSGPAGGLTGIPESAISGLVSDLAGKEPAVTASTTTRYYRGDKTFQTLDTSVVPENGSIYFTAARADARIALQAGANNGLAQLDSSGKVPAVQLPAYVDDVQEFANLAAFPATGSNGNIYVADDTGKVYRWSGSTYIEISPSPGSTDSVPEGSTNQYFTTARAAAAAPVQSVNGYTGALSLAKADVGLANLLNALQLVASNNLSDLPSIATARTNLGLGLIALLSVIDLTTNVTGVLPVANGGTGSASQNFVDLTTAQTVAGVKLFNDNVQLLSGKNFYVKGTDANHYIGYDSSNDGPKFVAFTAHTFRGAGGNEFARIAQAGISFGTAPTHTVTVPSTGTGAAFYNTSDQTTNYERARIYWTGNILTIATEQGGTGTARVINIGGSGGKAKIDNLGHITPTASTTAGASLTVPSGAAPTSPAAGDTWYDGTVFYQRVGAVAQSSPFGATQPQRTVTTAVTLANTDYLLRVNSASATTQTLPTAASFVGRVFVIKNVNTGAVTLATTASQTIDGATTYSLPNQYKYVTVQSNGTNWDVIGNN